MQLRDTKWHKGVHCQFRRAAGSFQTMPDARREHVALYQKWRHLDAEGDYANAIGIAGEMIHLGQAGGKPDKSGEACRDISLMKFQFWMDCEAAFQAAVQQSPRTEEPWIQRATALMELDRFEEAILSLENALSINPKSVDALWRLGLAKSEVARDRPIEESLHCFDRALELDQNLEIAWYYKAMVLSDAHRDEEALSCIEALLEELNPGNPFAWQLRGIILENLRRSREAQACYAQAANVSGRDSI
jgi:tetratricopeptide (TPR) repeat protein